jgi:oligopeptide transport system substrate-binding protein
MRLTITLLAVLLTTTACSSTAERPAPPQPGVLTVGLPEPQNLLRDRMIVNAMWTPLVDYNPANGQVTPRAAESVTSTDLITWTIKLRPGRYSNGDPVTAGSYVDAWSTIKGGQLFPYKKIEPLDDQTIKLEMSRPFSEVPAVLAAPYTLPVRLDNDSRLPIGNGPFRLAEPWQPGKGGRLIRNQEIPGKAKEIDLRVFDDPAKAYDEVQAGTLDLTVTVPGSRHEAMHRDFATRHVMWAKPEASYLAFRDSLTEPAARYAISMSLDRKALAAGVLQNQVDPATALIPPAVAPGERSGVCRACNNDPAAAKTLRDQANLTAIDIEIPAGGQDDPRIKAMTEQVRAALAVDTSSGPKAILITDFQETDSPQELFYDLKIDAVKQFTDAAEATADPAARAQQYRLAENQILRDLPLAPLWTAHGHAIWGERLHDVTATTAHYVDLTAISV